MKAHAGGRIAGVSLGVSVAVAAALTAAPAWGNPGRGQELACPNPTPDAFTDDEASVHETAINCMARWEVALGTSDSVYAPELDVRRDQTASFVVRLMNMAGFAFDGNPPDRFDDDNGNVHETSIDKLAAADIIRGSDDSAFSPAQDITRGQMAALLNRALAAMGHDESDPHEHFTDDDGPFEQDIDALASLGIVQGAGEGLYRPDLPVQRAPMAAFLARTADRLADRAAWPTARGSIRPPTDFTAAQAGSQQLLLTWTPPEDIRVDFYFMQASESPSADSCEVRVGGFTQQLDGGRSRDSYTHTGESGKTYCFRLRAVHHDDETGKQTDAPAVFAGPITMD